MKEATDFQNYLKDEIYDFIRQRLSQAKSQTVKDFLQSEEGKVYQDYETLKSQEREKVIREIWDLIFESFPSDMENLSTITPDQAYRLIKKLTPKLTNLK